MQKICKMHKQNTTGAKQTQRRYENAQIRLLSKKNVEEFRMPETQLRYSIGS